MAEIIFTDPAVAAKYATDQTDDKVHHLPGGTNGNGWRGKLSEVPLEVADRIYVRPGQNLLKLKETPAAASGKKKQEEKTEG